MPTAQRQYRLSVIQQLFEHPEKFELFQAVRLLTAYCSRHKLDGRRQPVGELIRFRSSVELSFPCGEIESLRRIETSHGDGTASATEKDFSQIELTTAVLGLTGVSGVMPRCYTELLLVREFSFRDKGPRAFLDIFANRLIGFFYQSWFKYRIPLHGDNDKNATYMAKASCLAGGIQSLVSPLRKTSSAGVLPAQFMAAYAGIFHGATISASTLQHLLADHFSVSVAVESFVGQWFSIPENERTALGMRSAALGKDSFCGERVWQRDQKLRIHIGPLNYERYREFIPGGPAMRMLQTLLQHWIGEAMEVEVDLVLDKDCIAPVRTHAQAAQLGMNVFLVSHPAMQHARQLRYELTTGVCS